MNRQRLPLVFMALVAVAPAHAAGALPPSPPPVHVELVDDATLDGMTGKFLGADMLTGVRIDLVSQLATAQGGTAQASGTLLVRRTDTGFEVLVDTRAAAAEGSAPTATSPNVVAGGGNLQVNGIGQVTQIAGDGNRLGNLAIIRVGAAPTPGGEFNGQTTAEAGAGDLVARVSFAGGGVQLGLDATGATLRQDVLPGGAGRIMQLGQIAGNGFVASNSLQLQMMTAAMPTLSMQQLGIQQALATLSGLRR